MCIKELVLKKSREIGEAVVGNITFIVEHKTIHVFLGHCCISTVDRVANKTSKKRR